MTERFRHEALLYAGETEFLLGTLPFIRQGLERHEPVLVVEPAEKISLLRRELGEDAALVVFANMSDVGANPAHIIPAWREFVDAHAGAVTPLRGIGEPISPSRRSDELVECQRHESLLNAEFARGRPWRLLCPYDTTSLSQQVIDEARRSHEYVTERHVQLRSPHFAGGAAAAKSSFGAALEAAPPSATSIRFAAQDLQEVRWITARVAAQSGLEKEACAGLIAAANEVATNSVVHGGGGGTLLAWSDRDSVFIEVRDRGRMKDALADRHRPTGTQSASGLWLANRLCDLVQIRSYPTGTVVRLVMRLCRPSSVWSWPEA